MQEQDIKKQWTREEKVDWLIDNGKITTFYGLFLLYNEKYWQDFEQRRAMGVPIVDPGLEHGFRPEVKLQKQDEKEINKLNKKIERETIQ